MNDIIDISMDFDKFPSSNDNNFGGSKNNFGGGIELLMNDKIKNQNLMIFFVIELGLLNRMKFIN